jgi:hypothetical protein
MFADFFVVQVAAAEYPAVLPPQIRLFGGIIHEVAGKHIPQQLSTKALAILGLFLRIEGNLPFFQEGNYRCRHRTIWFDVYLTLAMDVFKGEMTEGLLARFDSSEILFSPLVACFQFGHHHQLSGRLYQKNPSGPEGPPRRTETEVMMFSFISLGVSARQGSQYI